MVFNICLYLVFIVAPSLEGWPAKAKGSLSPHELKLTLLVTNVEFLSLSLDADHACNFGGT